MKIVCFRGLEFYLAYSFHQFLPNQNLQIVLENMSQRTDVKKIFRSMTKNNFFFENKKAAVRIHEFHNHRSPRFFVSSIIQKKRILFFELAFYESFAKDAFET